MVDRKIENVVVAGKSGAGKQHPILAWVGGESETITLTIRIWSQLGWLDQVEREGAGAALAAIGVALTGASALGGAGAGAAAIAAAQTVATAATAASVAGLALSLIEDDESAVKKQIDDLKSLTRHNTALGRPPICKFTAGDEIGYQLCVIETLGGIKYDDITNNGKLRGATLSMTLRRHEPAEIEANDANTIEPSTLHRYVKDGDTFDKLALRFYGNPLKGVNLRYVNLASNPEAETGELIKILEPDHSQITRAVRPRSIPFRPSAAQTLLHDAKLQVRQTTTTPITSV